MIQRYAAAGFVAFAVTAGLFYLMQALITKATGKLDEPVGSVVEFVRLKRDSEPELKKRELPKKQKPEEPPPPPDLNLSRSNRPEAALENRIEIGLDISMDGGPNLGLAVSDGDVVPVVRVNPQYPPRAAERGTEGWVELRFGISATGTVQDAEVTRSHPGRVFDRAALRAVRRWKYNPKIKDGNPVVRHGVTVRLEFELQDG